MDKKFSWYTNFPLEENTEFWNSAALSLDANVLLDLYRFHQSTRTKLLDAIKGFESRIWLSDQASEEFIRNRKSVIVEVCNQFDQAKGILKKLQQEFEKNVNELMSNRMLDSDALKSIQSDAQAFFETAVSKMENSVHSLPKLSGNDEIIDSILNIFSGRVGANYDKSKLSEVIEEAVERFQMKIPPGYEDEGKKEGNAQYGDYILWRQLIEQSATTKTDMIFVTSERKKDWWQQKSGKILGPRIELLREFSEQTGQRIVILQTDTFLKKSFEIAGVSRDDAAITEISELSGFHPNKGKAVHTNQIVRSSDSEYSKGHLHVNLLRPIFKFTASGAFDPKLVCVPSLDIELTELPSQCPEVHLAAGTGTEFDFNIHLKSVEFGQTLPVGRYVFKYIADCS